MGLLDMFAGTPGQQGLLAGSMAMLNAGGPSRMPVSLGQALAQGMGAGQLGYNNAIKRQQDAEEAAMQQQFREAQIQKMQADTEAKRRDDEMLDNLFGGNSVDQLPPSKLREGAVKLSITGHPLSPALFRLADQRDAQAAQDAERQGMMSKPVDMGPMVDPTLKPESPASSNGIFGPLMSAAQAMPKPFQDQVIASANRLEQDPTYQPKDVKADVIRYSKAVEDFNKEQRAAKERANARAEQQNFQREMRGKGAGSGGQSSLPKPPAGYAYGPPDESGMPTLVPLKGGPADTKLKGVLNQDTQMLNGSVASFDRLATAANEALNSPGLAGVYGLRGAIPNIPGSDAANAAALLNTLKSQVGFGVLQEMRNNSKTGGALGQISDKENQLLQDNLAALEKAQSVEQARESLLKIIKYANDAKDRMRGAYNMKHGDETGSPMSPASTTGPKVGDVEGGYRFKGGDPKNKLNWEKVQ